MPIYVYSAGHGFSCDERGAFDKAAHEQALQRTTAFFKQHIG
ncbi:MAG: dienelactone hydrolase family protein [Stellaceae bacterium]